MTTSASLGRNGHLRAPPSSNDPEARAARCEAIYQRFEHIAALAHVISDLDARRSRIEERMSDPVLLETYPVGSPEYDAARNKASGLKLEAQRFTQSLVNHGGLLAYDLKFVNDAEYRHLCATFGGGWKGHPLWTIVRGIERFQRCGEWQDLLAEEMRADGSRVPPF
jgi:hypothetical protein